MYTLVCVCESLLTSRISSRGLAHRVHSCFWASALDARPLRDEVCTRSLVIAAPSGGELPQYLIPFVSVLVVCLDAPSEYQGARSCNRRSPPFAERTVGAPTGPEPAELVLLRSGSPKSLAVLAVPLLYSQHSTRGLRSLPCPSTRSGASISTPDTSSLPDATRSRGAGRGGAGAADSMHAQTSELRPRSAQLPVTPSSQVLVQH